MKGRNVFRNAASMSGNEGGMFLDLTGNEGGNIFSNVPSMSGNEGGSFLGMPPLC